MKNGEAESPEMKEGDTLIYQMLTGYDTQEKVLTLNLATRSYIREADEWSEFNIIYRFGVLPNGRLRFLRLNLAG